MSYDNDRIFRLIPSIYRILDKTIASKVVSKHSPNLGLGDNIAPGPLAGLVSTISDEIRTIENDIFDLYDNLFIETCAEWVVPYIGDLVGSTYLKNTADLPISRRSYVANTIAYRRRKGTLFVLEQLAKDVTLWDAHAVEYFKYVITTQNLNHLRPELAATVNITRSPNITQPEQDFPADYRNRLDLVNTPFDNSYHLIDVRNIENGKGYYNIPNIGIFLWRHASFLLDDVKTYDHGNGNYSFDQIGIDRPLYNFPLPEVDIASRSREINLPTPLRTLELAGKIEKYYDHSPLFSVGNTVRSGVFGVYVDGALIPANEVAICDLSSWEIPEPGQTFRGIYIDPRLGRISFPKQDPTAIGTGDGAINRIHQEVRVRYHYGFSSKLGGGPYTRPQARLSKAAEKVGESRPVSKLYKIRKKQKMTDEGVLHENDNHGHDHSDVDTSSFDSIRSAIEKWKYSDNSPTALFEIEDSEVYQEEILRIEIPVNVALIISAKQGERPVIKTTLKIKGEHGSALVLDGLLLTSPFNNLAVVEPGDLGLVEINHCTLVPQLAPSIDRVMEHMEGIEEEEEDEDEEQRELEPYEASFEPLFTWNNVSLSDKDSNRLITYLKQNLSDMDWLKDKDQITIDADNNNRISISDPEGNNEVVIDMNNDTTRAVLTKKSVVSTTNRDEDGNINQIPDKRMVSFDLIAKTDRNDPSHPVRIYADPSKTSISVGSSLRKRFVSWSKLTGPNEDEKILETKKILDFIDRNYRSFSTDYQLSDFDHDDDDDDDNTAGFISLTIPKRNVDDNSNASENLYMSLELLGFEQLHNGRALLKLIGSGGSVEYDGLYYRTIKTNDGGTQNREVELFQDYGNNSLEIKANHSIIGKLMMKWPSLFTWEHIPPVPDRDDTVGIQRLVYFLHTFLNIQPRTESSSLDLRELFTKSDDDLEATSNPDVFSQDGIPILVSIKLNKSENTATIFVRSLEGNNPDNNNDNSNHVVVDLSFDFLVQERDSDKIVIYHHPETKLIMTDSILDGSSNSGGNKNPVLNAYDSLIDRSTVFGEVKLSKLELASNSIFTDRVDVKRRQEGCMRFCYVPEESYTPPRFKCRPDKEVGSNESRLIKPFFRSIRYGDPGYAQLDHQIPEIFEGADNQAEMGAFNHLYQPQRIKDLRDVLDEYLRFGMRAGIILV